MRPSGSQNSSTSRRAALPRAGFPASWQTCSPSWAKLTPAQKAAAARVNDNIWLLEPFVEAVMDAFTNGAYQAPFSFKGFRTTDDRRWVIGMGHFVQNGVRHRIEVQYSLNYGAVTSVLVDQGGSKVDQVFDSWNDYLRGPGASPYYGINVSQVPAEFNLLALDSTGIVVKSSDRKLGTLDIEVSHPDAQGDLIATTLTVPGTSIADRSGYLRQMRGERYEFVPADLVYLYGKGTLQALWIEADGAIGKITMPTFKGPAVLCAGAATEPALVIRYGDNVVAAAKAYEAAVGTTKYRECELVFNHSENGNLLLSVSSLTNKISVSTVDGRAVTASIWR